MKQVPKQIKAIIFDMDGVIVDSEPLQLEIERKVCNDFNIHLPLSEWDHFKGIREKDMWEYIVNNFTDGSISASTLMEHKINSYLKIASQKVQLIPGAREFIKKAKKRIGKLALTTSQVQRVQQFFFNKFNLNPYFDVVTTAEGIQHGKPNPEPYLKTVEKLKIPAKNSLIIEDSDNGIISAKTAGCIAVGITTSFPKERLQQAGADYIVDTFKELSHLLFSTAVKKR